MLQRAQIEGLIRQWRARGPSFLWAPTSPDTWLLDRIKGVRARAVGQGAGIHAGGVHAYDYPGSSSITFSTNAGITGTSPYHVGVMLVSPRGQRGLVGALLKIGGSSSGLAYGLGYGTIETPGPNAIGLFENVSWYPSTSQIIEPGLNVLTFGLTSDNTLFLHNARTDVQGAWGTSGLIAPSADLSIGGYILPRESSLAVHAVVIFPVSRTNAQIGAERGRLAAPALALAKTPAESVPRLFTPKRRLVLARAAAAGGTINASSTGVLPVAGTATAANAGRAAAAGSMALVGTASASAAVAGAAAGTLAVTGTAAAAVSGAASSAGAVTLAGAASASSSVAASAAGALPITGTATATVAAGAGLQSAGTVPITGAATATARVAAAAAATLPVTGTAAGAVQLVASAAAVLPITGTATAAAAGANTAQAAGVLPIAATAAATSRVAAVAAGALTITGAATATQGAAALLAQSAGQINMAGLVQAAVGIRAQCAGVLPVGTGQAPAGGAVLFKPRGAVGVQGPQHGPNVVQVIRPQDAVVRVNRPQATVARVIQRRID